MTAFAAIADWRHAPSEDAFRRMVPDPGATRFQDRAVALAQNGTEAVAVLGETAAVGIARLFDRDAVAARFGVPPSLSDLDLVLAAHRALGDAVWDALDGEWGVVLWDGTAQRIIASRDPFGVVPLFVHRGDGAVRFAGRIRQLRGPGSPEWSPSVVAGYLGAGIRDRRGTFHAGIERVLPGTTIIATADGVEERRHWNPNPAFDGSDTEDLPDRFRQHLIDAVDRRTSASSGVVAHLSGGLDSPAVAASLTLLDGTTGDRPPVVTASVRFPGSATDESPWIDDLVASQPFDHVDADAAIPTIDQLIDDIRTTSTPEVPLIRAMWALPAGTVRGRGFDTVLSGMGGDEVLEQDRMLIDRLRSHPVTIGIPDLVSLGRSQPRELAWVLRTVARDVAPASLIRALRPLRPRSRHGGLLHPDLASQPATPDEEGALPVPDGVAWSQYAVLAATQAPVVARYLETQTALLADSGAHLSTPMLDRRLVEFVASIPPELRPFDGRRKTLTRLGFADELPASVLARRHGTVADDHLARVIAALAPGFVERFPTVPDPLVGAIDAPRYAGTIRSIDGQPPPLTSLWPLWTAWSLMLWAEAT